MASASAWAAFDELLIKQIQENDIIYNKTNKEFKDANLKKKNLEDHSWSHREYRYDPRRLLS